MSANEERIKELREAEEHKAATLVALNISFRCKWNLFHYS